MSADPTQTVFASYFDRAFAKLGTVLEPCVPRPVTANAITLASIVDFDLIFVLKDGRLV